MVFLLLGLKWAVSGFHNLGEAPLPSQDQWLNSGSIKKSPQALLKAWGDVHTPTKVNYDSPFGNF
jgi:hypothetical protein